MSTTYTDTEPWKRQPACSICNLQHAGYERAHTETGDSKDYSANFPSEHPDREEGEFAAWYDAEIEPLRGPFSFREIALRAFRQGLAIGREGRA